jgi:predicted phage terminase large subunit-like protein
MTRWHQDDLAGRLLQTQGERWEVLRLPALAEDQETRDANDAYLGLPTGQPDPLGRAPGAPLCPRRYSKAALEAIREDVGAMVWAAEYQGIPRPREGAWFKRSYFPLVESAPKSAARVRYWDPAGTTEGGCATAGVLLAYANGVIYVEDVVRGFWSSHERDTVIRQTAEMDQARGRVAIYVEQEPGSGGKAQVEAIIQKLVGFAVRPDRPTGDKDTRLEPFVAQAEAGNVRLVRGAWNGAFIEEMIAVPNGAYRDQADAAAGALSRLPRAQQAGTPAFG